MQQKDGALDFLQEVCRNRKVVLDVHHPDRLWDLPGERAIYHCQAFADQVQEHVKQIQFIPLMCPEMGEGGRALFQRETKYVIGWHGLWIPHKGVEKLIQAVALMRDRRIDVSFFAIGGLHDINLETRQKSWDYWIQCNDAAFRHDVQPFCQMWNELLPYPDVRATLEVCDVMCLPYDLIEFHDQSSAAAAAIAVERPLVVTKVPMFDEWADTAHFLSGDSPACLADELGCLLRDTGAMKHYVTTAKLAHAERSRQSISEQYKVFVEGV